MREPLSATTDLWFMDRKFNMKYSTHQHVKLTFLVCASLGWLCGSVATAQQAQPLQWKFTTGDSFEVTFIQTSEITSQVDQRIKDVNSVLTVAMAWQVTSVDETGNATIDQRITGVKLLMTSLPTGVGRSIDIDTSRSEKPKKGVNSNLLKQIEPLVGAAYQVVMSPRGEIVEVTVPETTLESLRQVPGSLRLRSLMSKAGLKDLFGQAMVVLPEADPVADQPWTSLADVDTEVGNFTRQHTYTWTENRTENGKTLADINLTTTLEPRETDKTGDVKFISYHGNGTLTMNVTDGYFESSKTTNEMQTEKPYREKVIATTAKTTVEMQIEKN